MKKYEIICRVEEKWTEPYFCHDENQMEPSHPYIEKNYWICNTETDVMYLIGSELKDDDIIMHGEQGMFEMFEELERQHVEEMNGMTDEEFELMAIGEFLRSKDPVQECNYAIDSMRDPEDWDIYEDLGQSFVDEVPEPGKAHMIVLDDDDDLPF